MTTWLSSARRNPSAVLLVVQLLGILVYPFLGDQPASRAAFNLFSLAVLVIAVMAVRMTPALSWVAILIGVPVVVLTVVEVVWPHDTVALWSAILHAAFYFYTAYALIRYMFSDNEVHTDEVWSTGATFTVVAWAFAYVYAAVQLVWPGSLIAAVDPDSARAWHELLFLSVTTLTNTGLSDIVPIQPQARSFVMLEEIAGMLYLALVVSRVMALLSARAARAQVRAEEASVEASTWEPMDAEEMKDTVAPASGDEQVDEDADQTTDPAEPDAGEHAPLA